MQYLTVSALNKYLRYKFENDSNLNDIYLKGEISNFKVHQKGGIFLSLKDSASSIQAYINPNLAKEVSLALADGIKVLVKGSVSVYVPYGSYRMTIDEIQIDGVGELYLKLEALKKKLDDEGLFKKPKRNIPKYPKRIGVITSKTGAVIEDIKKTVNLRYPLAKIILYPATVQGIDSKNELVEKINIANNDNIDVLIIGRGGGSIEDLWAFNEEIVVRAISESRVPVISAIGHETDTTLSDLVSDLRASTPTGAAMSSTPNIKDIYEKLMDYNLRVNNSINKIINDKLDIILGLNRIIKSNNPVERYNKFEERLKGINNSLKRFKSDYFKALEYRLENNINNLNKINLNTIISDYNLKIEEINNNLDRNIKIIFERKEDSFSFLISKLKVINPFNLLDKGYSVASVNGKIIKSINDVSINDLIEIKVKDGIIKAEVK